MSELRRRFEADAGSGQGRTTSPLSSPARRRSPASGPSAADRRPLQGPPPGRRADHRVRPLPREGAQLAKKLDRPVDEVMDDADASACASSRGPEPAGDRRLPHGAEPDARAGLEGEVDLAALDRLRDVNRKHALVFLPSHRSYVDPLVLAEVLARTRLPAQPPARRRQHVLLADRPARQRAGVIFIRRSFGDDDVYKLAVSRVPRPPRRQALQPRVVHRGRPHADRQAAPAEVRAAALPRQGDRGRPRRGRDARPRLDRLRPPERGRRDGGRAGRGQARRPRGWAGSPTTPARRVRTSAARRCVSASRSRCARRSRTPARMPRSSRRSRSASATGSTA